MALLPSLLRSKPSLIRSTLFLSFRLNPTISPSPSFSLSTQCKREEHPINTFSLPPRSPPLANKLPFTVSAHGMTWQDPYHWMRDTHSPDFVDYLHQENSYADAFMGDTQNLRRSLLYEMKARMPTKISTPPERSGPWLYYQYIPEEKEYPVLCRRLETKKNGWPLNLLRYVRGEFPREEVLLDWNEVAEQYGYVNVGTCRISPDHNVLAYTLDTTGSEQFMLQIKDLRTGLILPRSPVDSVVSLAWAQDGCTLFYTIADENQRPYRVLCTTAGSEKEHDALIFTENDSSFCVDITSTKDGKFITVYVVDATDTRNRLRRIRERVSGVQYFLEHHYGMFYILTNAPLSDSQKCSFGGYYLATSRVEDIQSANWQTMLRPSEDISLQDMDVFHGHLVLFLNKKGVPMLCSINLPIIVDCENQLEIENLNPWFFPLPSNACSMIPGSNHDFMNSVYRVVLSSPVMPDLTIDYDMSRRTFSILQQEEVKSVSGAGGSCLQAMFTTKNVDGEDQNLKMQSWMEFSNTYCCERKEIIAHDGVRVPLTILYSRKVWEKDRSPGLLQGYGAYGEVLDKIWCTDRLSLLDRGWVVAFADVRGGGGGDSSWHKSGCGFYKKNSVYDFASCGEYLVKEGYVHRERLGAIGCSAGCLLVGAALNMYQDLFRAAILKVPFLDICNTLLDPSLPLSILDYEEFGNPQIQSQFESILSYSPYDNISRGGCYPSMLVTASFHDSRVGVWEAAKWVAKLRDSTCSDCSRSVILKTNMTGGHFGEGGRYARCEETAYDYAFLIKVLGVSDSTK